MTYLLDTDWVIDFLRGRIAAHQLPTSLRSGELAISLVTYGEIYDGIDQSADPINAEVGFLRLLRYLAIVPLDEASIRRFFQVRGELRRRGTPLEDLDLIVAATALHHNLTLVTRNRRHFARVPNLTLYP